jgi:hypothetical protein
MTMPITKKARLHAFGRHAPRNFDSATAVTPAQLSAISVK